MYVYLCAVRTLHSNYPRVCVTETRNNRPNNRWEAVSRRYFDVFTEEFTHSHFYHSAGAICTLHCKPAKWIRTQEANKNKSALRSGGNSRDFHVGIGNTRVLCLFMAQQMEVKHSMCSLLFYLYLYFVHSCPVCTL